MGRDGQQDVMEVVLEARKLADEVKRLEGEKQEKETASQAMSQQYGILSEKVQKLQIELTEAKTSAHRKQHVLELKKQECFKLSLAVEDLQRKLDGEVCRCPSFLIFLLPTFSYSTNLPFCFLYSLAETRVL